MIVNCKRVSKLVRKLKTIVKAIFELEGKPFVSNCDTSIAIKVLLQSASPLELQKYNCTSLDWVREATEQPPINAEIFSSDLH